MASTIRAPLRSTATRVLAGVVRRFKRVLMRFILEPTYRLEDELASRPDVIHAGPDSPRRIEIVAESIEVEGLHRPMPGFPRSMPHVLSSARNIVAALQELDDNPIEPRTTMLDAERGELEAFMRSVGVDTFGYTQVPQALIFEGKALLHTNAIVLTMEMDKERMDTAPSPDAAVMVHETYNQLGIATNKIARYLREQGYSAQAGHPLGGLALYPPLAQAAGLGWQGMHGLLITPEFGPRVRLAAVFTGIEDLPDTRSDTHAWIDDFCRECVKCVRRCPPKAIRTEPVRHESGRTSCVDPERCLPYFVRNNGCSICIAVCPFHQRDYEWLHERWQRHGDRALELRANPPEGFPQHLRQQPPRLVAMANYRVMSWRGIPSQVTVSDETGATVREQLPPFFQQEIDRVAMAEGLIDSDAYLDDWVWSDEAAREGSAADVADALIEELAEEWRRVNRPG